MAIVPESPVEMVERFIHSLQPDRKTVQWIRNYLRNASTTDITSEDICARVYAYAAVKPHSPEATRHLADICMFIADRVRPDNAGPAISEVVSYLDAYRRPRGSSPSARTSAQLAPLIGW